ncbi:PAAR domain-containing protein [Burkholderia sp. Ac-20353]|uniref:PAAR domain-containing protein n=1 Tax=Burkholderia sp. Ac-20353 TaxID=2703894 RepID=UPI00197B0959|nr:PAAR domain-containing protein [Burkholderia sp. Ac-20353]MBN3790841.1 PAAR domain-containing protein [Burkholderia sp. Ac-20353]
MKRNHLKVGDRSSAGGTAIDGIPNCAHYGGELTFIGGQVTCPACHSTGRIAAKGPRWPAKMMGKEPALEGDICICKCSPPPTMIASQDNMFQIFEADALQSMGFSSNGNTLEHESSTYDQHFRIINSDGEPVEGLPYLVKSSDGSVIKGVTSSNGTTDLMSADAAHQVDFLLHIKRGE